MPSKVKEHPEEYYKNPKRCAYCANVFPYEDKHRHVKLCCNARCAAYFKNMKKRRLYEKSPKKCKQCSQVIEWGDRNRMTKIFCSDPCMREFNKTETSNRVCEGCSGQYTVYYRAKQKFCSHDCRAKSYSDKMYSEYISGWIAGNESGSSSKLGEINRHVRRYLIEKRGEKCWHCGFDKKNPVSGYIPLDVDYIDGNSLNNSPNNLRVLCRNCHALTPTYGHLNTGKGACCNKKGKEMILAFR